MFEIIGANAVVHPRAVMIHSWNTAIANTTMMRMRWLVWLTLTAHGDRRTDNFARLGTRWNSTWIGKLYFDMTRQCQSSHSTVSHTPYSRNASRLGQEGYGDHTIPQQHPYHTSHHCPCLIARIPPNSIFFRCTTRPIIRLLIKCVYIVCTVSIVGCRRKSTILFHLNPYRHTFNSFFLWWWWWWWNKLCRWKKYLSIILENQKQRSESSFYFQKLIFIILKHHIAVTSYLWFSPSCSTIAIMLW